MTVDARTIVQLSYFEALELADLDDQRMIQLAREYYGGDQTAYLTSRAEEFLALNSKVKFRLNIIKTIVQAILDEMNVVGFETSEPKQADGTQRHAQWASQVWDDNRMDATQNDVHEAVFRDREAFVIVDWDAQRKIPRLTFHERYVSTEAGGNGTGCWMVYENDDPNQKPIAAVKQWVETVEENGSLVTQARRTVYYADRVEKWVYGDGGWVRYTENGQPADVPWLRAKKKPRGIPVIHFKNEGMMIEAWDGLPMQDAVNKIAVDVLGAADAAGIPIYKAFGFFPTTDGQAPKEDGSNLMEISPGAVVGSTKSKNDASFDAVPGADVKPLVETLIEIITITAQITSTPVSRFVMTRQVAGAETIKEQDKPLRRKAKKRRILCGNGWEDVMSMARIIDNDFGRAGLDETIPFSTVWEHSTSLDELKTKREALSIPLEQLWREAGYSSDQIKAMKETEEYRLMREKLLWEAASAAQDAGVSLETVLRRAGITAQEFGKIGTEKLADIQLEQEDTIPPVEQ